ncbi:hypothetical protein Q5752_002075 [Cryptotrichosporon argae]
MSDPNFPPDLDIHPLVLAGTDNDDRGQAAAIAKYGIAGRVWEASLPLLSYLTPGSPFDPPCSVHSTPSPRRILEFGSGQALSSLHVASHLGPDDLVVLTDLPNVVPLCEASIDAWTRRAASASTDEEHKDGPAAAATSGATSARVVARPLAWGESGAAVKALGPFTHILMCDLVYFPQLYPPLLYTLLEMTEPDGVPDEASAVFGPEIIISYRTRQLVLEQSFFDTLASYFSLAPVLDAATGAPPLAWGDTRLFTCRRWRVTDEWALPASDAVMRADPRGVVRGRCWGLEDGLFGAMEWD